MRIKKGDKVAVLAGKDRGKRGEVIRALPRADKVIVAGVNVVKRHTKPKTSTTQGGIIEKDMPIHVSNVAIVCSKCGPTRIGMRVESDGTSKARICRKCGGDL